MAIFCVQEIRSRWYQSSVSSSWYQNQVCVFVCERDILLVPEPDVQGFLLGLSAEQAGITD